MVETKSIVGKIDNEDNPNVSVGWGGIVCGSYITPNGDESRFKLSLYSKTGPDGKLISTFFWEGAKDNVLPSDVSKKLVRDYESGDLVKFKETLGAYIYILSPEWSDGA